MKQDAVEFLRRSPTLFHAAKTVQSAGRGVRRAFWTATRAGAIGRYLASHEVRKLQVGAGQFPTPGWLNTDLDPTVSRRASPDGPRVVFLDATRRFPFADHTFDYAFSEHVIEHVPYDPRAPCSRNSTGC